MTTAITPQHIYRKHLKDKYFFMLMMFIWCSGTAPFFKIISTESLWAICFHFPILIYYFKKYYKKENIKFLLTIFGIYLFWWILQCIKNNNLQGIDTILISQTFAAFIAFNLYQKQEFFYYFEKVLVHLTILSLIIWSTSLLLPKATEYFMKGISVYTNNTTCMANIGIVGLSDQFVMGIRRNIGFTWEAGRFSGFLIIGLFINLIRHRIQIQDFNRNKNYWILLIGLISTISTTGYGAFIGIIILYFFNKSTQYRIAMIFLGILAIPAIWGLSFMQEKIIDTLDIQKEIVNMYTSFSQYGTESITPQRFTGLYLDAENFIHDFWIGYGKNESSYVNTTIFQGYDVWVSDGIIQILSKYGIIIGMFFYIQLFKSSSILAKEFHYKGKYLFAISFLLISISYNYWECCILLYIIFYSLYSKFQAKHEC